MSDKDGNLNLAIAVQKTKHNKKDERKIQQQRHQQNWSVLFRKNKLKHFFFFFFFHLHRSKDEEDVQQ
jgi:hypothetical protein